jgi:Ca-activated chloride channel family protein
MLPGNRVGLVIFAGNPVTWSPLTLDRSAVEAFLDRAGPDSIPLKGTSLEAAVREAAASLAAGRGGTDRSDRNQAILLVTDGEDHAGDIPAVINYAKEQGLSIYTLGVGTEKGGPIPEGFDFFGKAQYKYFNGKLVNSRLQPDNLKNLADETGGKYFYADSNDVVRRMAAAISSLNKAVVPDEAAGRRNELFQLPLMLCLVLLLIEGLIPERPVITGEGGITA